MKSWNINYPLDYRLNGMERESFWLLINFVRRCEDFFEGYEAFINFRCGWNFFRNLLAFINRLRNIKNIYTVHFSRKIQLFRHHLVHQIQLCAGKVITKGPFWHSPENLGQFFFSSSILNNKYSCCAVMNMMRSSDGSLCFYLTLPIFIMMSKINQ